MIGRRSRALSASRPRSTSAASRTCSGSNAQDPESFKTRKGEIGGYAGYLTDEDVAYVEARIAELVPETTGHREPGLPPTRIAAPVP